MITALITTICTGKETIDKVNNRLRKIVDNCDNVAGVVANHSMGGGTGPGLGTPKLERIAMDYRKKSKLDFEAYSSPTISTCVVEPHNTLLTTHWLLDHNDISGLPGNELMYGICQKHLDIKRPSCDGQAYMRSTNLIVHLIRRQEGEDIKQGRLGYARPALPQKQTYTN